MIKFDVLPLMKELCAALRTILDEALIVGRRNPVDKTNDRKRRVVRAVENFVDSMAKGGR
jgi:hypothetical protein